MNEFSVDLSMRSSGCSYFYNGELLDFTLVSNSELKDEQLLISNVSNLINWIEKVQGCTAQPDRIRIEGLSFGSQSGSKDVIAGQFWMLRCELVKKWPCTKIEIVPVTSWRSPLFNKAERKELTDAKKLYTASKKSLKGLKGLDRKAVMCRNKELELACSIKEATWNKLDPKTQKDVLDYITKNNFEFDARYDICDSIWLGKFTGSSVKIKKEKKKK
jgi:hypothetical protein